MHSQITASDTYDIYYANPDLLTSHPAQPAEYPPGEVWTLNERRGDATVDDICDFIVEFINSDVMVRANSTFVSISN
jgi:RNA-dependent RNA polymerase